MLCIISLFTSALALGSIFGELTTGSRIIVLCTFWNAILRICFAMIILFIAYRDIMQIIINLSVRYTGAISKHSDSRFIYVEALLRMGITTLALVTILFTIFSTVKDEYEGVIDQTMNFTALVILLEIDNILAGVFQKRIEKLDINFAYNPETVEHEFRRAAHFMNNRKSYFYG